MTGGCLRGPVDANKSAWRAAFVPLAFDDVELDAHRYLGAWQALNRTAILPHCIDRLEANGSLDNLRRLVGKSDAAYRGMVFQDSDIHKTLEAVAWVLGQQEQPELRRFLDSTAALFEAAQDEDGYLNSWFQGVHPEQRWQDLRWGHEMYCAGHLVQAAVYCVEEGDVGESISIDDVALDPRRVAAPVSNGTSAVAPVVLEGPVQVVAAPADQSLYQPHVVNDATAARKEVTMRAIPYFRWANRGRCAMRVWLPLVQA